MDKFEALRFTDDFMFNHVMQDKEICRLFIEALTGRKIQSIEEHAVQKTMQGEFGLKSIRFDVYFMGDHEVYDIEMQQQGKKDLFKRTRYYQSMIDRYHLDAGVSYAQLPNSMVIFLCTYDPFGHGLAVYNQKPCILELSQTVDTGASVLYLNAQYSALNASREIGNLLSYMRNPEDVGNFLLTSKLVNAIDARVASVKRDYKLRGEFMSLDEIKMWARDEGRDEGISEGRKEGLRIGRAREREEAIKALMQNLGISREKAEGLLSTGANGTEGGGPVTRMHIPD